MPGRKCLLAVVLERPSAGRYARPRIRPARRYCVAASRAGGPTGRSCGGVVERRGRNLEEVPARWRVGPLGDPQLKDPAGILDARRVGISMRMVIGASDTRIAYRPRQIQVMSSSSEEPAPQLHERDPKTSSNRCQRNKVESACNSLRYVGMAVTARPHHLPPESRRGQPGMWCASIVASITIKFLARWYVEMLSWNGRWMP